MRNCCHLGRPLSEIPNKDSACSSFFIFFPFFFLEDFPSQSEDLFLENKNPFQKLKKRGFNIEFASIQINNCGLISMSLHVEIEYKEIESVSSALTKQNRHFIRTYISCVSKRVHSRTLGNEGDRVWSLVCICFWGTEKVI